MAKFNYSFFVPAGEIPADVGLFEPYTEDEMRGLIEEVRGGLDADNLPELAGEDFRTLTKMLEQLLFQRKLLSRLVKEAQKA